MRRIVVSIFAASLLFASQAFAADMPVKAPPPPTAAPGWTGWYLGGNAGGFWGASRTTSATTPIPGAGFTIAALAIINAQGAPANIDTSGFTGGVQGGYNYQVGQWLVGLEADFEAFHNKDTLTSAVPGVIAGSTFVLNSTVNADWLLTVRPRLGWVANNWLLYGTGGLAVSRVSAAWNFTNPGGVPTFTESASTASTKTGWTAGGGVETMLPGRWVVGVEYLYVKLGNISTSAITISSVAGPINPFSHSVDFSSNIVRLRLSKAF